MQPFFTGRDPPPLFLALIGVMGLSDPFFYHPVFGGSRGWCSGTARGPGRRAGAGLPSLPAALGPGSMGLSASSNRPRPFFVFRTFLLCAQYYPAMVRLLIPPLAPNSEDGQE